MPMPEIVIGTAMPRSGTTSLSVLLHECRGAEVYHEEAFLPFNAKAVHFRRQIERLKRDYHGRYVGDVSWMWLPYLHMLQSETDAHIVGLVREKEPLIESCVETQPDERFGQYQYSWPTLDVDSIGPEEAWSRYYDYAMERFETLGIPTFRTRNLSDQDTQEQILDAAGIAEEDRQYHPNLRYNAR